MLTARELFNGMGFPKNYIIERDYTGKKYPTTKQKEKNVEMQLFPYYLKL